MGKYLISELINDKNYKQSRYHEFLRVKDMSAGIYRLAASIEDVQKPHTEDEIYHIVQGEGRFCIENEEFEVQEGSF